MSCFELEYGFVAKLKTPLDFTSIPEEDRYCMDYEEYFNLPENFKLNYEGTLIRCVMHNEYDVESGFFKVFNPKEKIQFPLPIEGEPKPYLDYWYNGSDNNMNLMKLSDFESNS